MTVRAMFIRAYETIWRDKSLWVFGAFAAVGGVGLRIRPGAGVDGPSLWLVPLVFGVGLVGVLFGIMHLLSEGALIRGVIEGAHQPLRRRLREARPFLGRLFRLKVVAATVILVSGAIVIAPAGLASWGLFPTPLGIIGTVGLTIVGLPWLLTVYFIYQYAMRGIVLGDLSVRGSIRDGYDRLHGGLSECLRVLVTAFLGQLGSAVVGAALILPAVIAGGVLYLAAGPVLGIVLGALLGVPAACVVTGALGAFTSALWTLHYAQSQES